MRNKCVPFEKVSPRDSFCKKKLSGHSTVFTVAGQISAALGSTSAFFNIIFFYKYIYMIL